MAGVTLLLIGSTRISQQGFQNQQAFEIARGAMSLMQRDLSRAFTARNHGDYYTFYGTPIGFTFVGIASPRDRGSGNVARITYVIHQRDGAPVLRDVEGGDRYIYDLVRYVEPNVEDLYSFDVDWDTALTDGSGTLQDLIDDEVAASIPVPCLAADIPCREQVEDAMRRQLWIRMLSRLEIGFLPDLWDVLDNGAELDSLDYVLAENILSVEFPAADAFAVPIFTSDNMPFFEYAAFIDRTTVETGVVEDATNLVPPPPIQITSTGHGLRTNRLVTITGVGGNTNANGTFYITVIDNNTFSLPGIAGNEDYTQGGTWTEDGRAITDATNTGPIVITDLGHELTTGEEIVVSGVTGNFAANGRHFITTAGFNAVSLDASTGNGSYASGGTWIRVGKIENTQLGSPIIVVDTDHGLQTGDEIVVTGVEINTAANGSWFVTRIDADNFMLNNSQENGIAAANTGDWIEAVDEVKAQVAFWNDTRNQLGGGLSAVDGLGTPFEPHMPEEVLTHFTLFFQSPVPGAPDFERTFDQRIDIPAGYQRPFREQ